MLRVSTAGLMGALLSISTVHAEEMKTRQEFALEYLSEATVLVGVCHRFEFDPVALFALMASGGFRMEDIKPGGDLFDLYMSQMNGFAEVYTEKNTGAACDAAFLKYGFDGSNVPLLKLVR